MVNPQQSSIAGPAPVSEIVKGPSSKSFNTATFPKRDPEVTKRLIKAKFRSNTGADVATEAVQVSLKCPLGKKRITTPCRPNKCDHVQCFDLEAYLAMHQSIQRTSKMSKWDCPICPSKDVFDDLSVDMYFVEILNFCKAKSVDIIELNSDGSWHLGTSQSNNNQSVIQVDDGSQDSDTDIVEIVAFKRKQEVVQKPSSWEEFPRKKARKEK